MKANRALRAAWQGIATNKLRTILMMLGIVVGVAALTVIMAVGEGTKADLARRASQMWTATQITVFPKQPNAPFGPGHMGGIDALPPTLTVDDARAIAEQVPNVATAAPAANKPNVPLKYRANSTDGMVIGVTPEWQTLRSYTMAEGDPISQDDDRGSARVCVLGPTIVRELFGEDDPIGATIRIENTPFRVKGVAAAKGTNPMGMDFDSRVLIPLTTFSRRLYNITYVTNIAIALKDPARRDRSAADIEALLRDRHAVGRVEDEDFTARTESSIVGLAGRSSHTLTLFLAIVAAISLLVGGVVVMNVMLISVSERTREIGVRRAVGASQRDILAQFRAEALLITLTAGLGGVVVGSTVSLALPLVSHMHTVFSWQAVALAVVFSTVIGLVFGIQPARRAARLDPVQALRAE